jgi:hypothetical protein
MIAQRFSAGIYALQSIKSRQGRQQVAIVRDSACRPGWDFAVSRANIPSAKALGYFRKGRTLLGQRSRQHAHRAVREKR